MKNNKLWGLVLIFIGILLILRPTNLLTGAYFIIVMGLGILALYFLSKGTKQYINIIFLLLSLLLISLGVYSLARDYFALNGLMNPFLILILISFCFFATDLIHTMHFKDEAWIVRHWPLIPGGCFLIPAFVFSLFLGYLQFYCGTIMILIGSIILVSYCSSLFKSPRAVDSDFSFESTTSSPDESEFTSDNDTPNDDL